MEKVFGPSKQKIVWQQLAEEIGGDFTYAFMKGSKIVTSFKNWTIILDTYAVSTGKSTTVYTRMSMPYVKTDSFNFKIYSSGFFSSIGKFFGMQDVKIGQPEFDEKYIIKSNDEEKVRQLLSSKMLRNIMDNHPQIYLEIKDRDGGVMGKPLPDKVNILYFQEVGIIKDIDRLKQLYLLFDALIKQLIEIGAATEADPGI